MAGSLVLGGCGSTPDTAYDLTAPRPRGAIGLGTQLVVTEPAALQAFESERIAVRSASGTVSVLPNGQWADRLPRLVQARIIQTFENGSRTRSVGRPGDGLTPDTQLNTELRTFQFDAGRGEGVVEISAKLVDSRSGRVLNSRIFSSRQPVGSGGVAEVAPALDRALSAVLLDMVRWVGASPKGAPPAAADANLRTGSL
ncbi:MAG: hypothetical protein JWR08_1486 [Enterovirga sp.]|jgi:cholesterol transport system auxiliary component|nr:hypothetical protein [Enterovirga sp.]